MVPKFKIGEGVEVSGLVHMKLEYVKDGRDRRVLSRIPVPPFSALITGKSVRYEGEIVRGWDEPSFFNQSKCHEVWLIRQGLTNKEEAVLEDDIVKAWVSTDFPTRFMRQTPWSDDCRAQLRKDMAEIPRDTKGRWLKVETGNG